MRKLLLALLFPFALLLAQQGAVSHEIGHLAADVHSPARGSHAPGEPPCDTCLAFAHLAAIATVQVIAPELLSLREHFAPVALPASVEAAAPPARSRDPPISL